MAPRVPAEPVRCFCLLFQVALKKQSICMLIYRFHRNSKCINEYFRFFSNAFEKKRGEISLYMWIYRYNRNSKFINEYFGFENSGAAPGVCGS